MVFLVLLFWILVYVSFASYQQDSIRANILKAFLVTFFLVGFSTEILSLFNLITYRAVLMVWILSTSITALFLIVSWYKKSQEGNTPKRSWGEKDTSPKWFVGICISILIIITGVTLFIALKSPPNNFDSMTYHMARVSHWIRNGHIRYYPTQIPRQNYSMPLAEYGILHLQILSQGDHYANLIQWSSFLISIITSTLIAKDLKVSRRGQWITAVLTATVPMAILQSTSTQNDLVVSVFCLAFAYFLSRSIKTQKWEDVVFAALAMGFALATKGTAYIYIAAIGLGVGSAALFGKKWELIKGLIYRYSIIIFVGLFLNSGIYLRNLALYKNPLITSNERTLVGSVSPKILGANLVRNGVIHLSSPIGSANQFVERSVSGLLGSEMDNPESTFQGSHFELSFSINEDDAGNGLHLILILLAILILPWIKSDNKKDLLYYEAAIVLSILLFSLVFRWQPWGGRLQTPIFIFGCILIGFLFDHNFKKDLLPSLVILFLLLASTPYLFLNSNRPLLPIWEDDSVFHDTALERRIISGINQKLENYPGLSDNLVSFFSLFYEGRSVILTERRELYFLGNYEPYWDYLAACHFVRNDPSKNIGLLMDSNDWEYPLWVLTNQHASPGSRHLYHIQVEDISSDLSQDLYPIPELILVTRANYQNISFQDEYEQVYSSSSIQVMKLIK